MTHQSLTYRSYSSSSWIPTLINSWFLISTIIVFWDAGYCLLRPHTFSGGSLFFLYRPYHLYETIDKVYSIATFNKGDGFTAAQAWLNLIENGLNLSFLALERNGRSEAVVVGFAAVVATCWKTVLYWLMDALCYVDGKGWCQTGHNDLGKWLLLFALPNCLWIIIPGIIAGVFGNEIVKVLRSSSPATTTKKSKKVKSI